LKIGVIGTGTLSIRGIIPHLAQDDVAGRVALTAVADPVLDRAQAIAERYDIPHAYASIEELLGTGLDLVTIVSPIGLHYEHVRLALESGTHVHVNKTLCTTTAEADRLIELAAERGLHIVASPGEVLRPQVSRARELIAEGAIGDVSWALCGCAFETYHEDEPERHATAGEPINPSWYFAKPGGGPMYDMTVYSLHQLTSILGPVRAVTGQSGQRIALREFDGHPVRADADDNTILTLDFGDGIFAVAFGTVAGWASDQFAAAKIYGSRGTIEGVLLNDHPFDFPRRELTLDQPITDWEAQMRVLPHVKGPHLQIPESHVFEDIMQLVQQIETGQPTPVTAEHARHVIEIIELGYRAAETGVRQELRTTFTWPPTATGSQA
jgi:predicted dehydrogenase